MRFRGPKSDLRALGALDLYAVRYRERLNVSPDELYGIQVWCVGRQTNNCQPSALLPQVLLHSAASV